MVAAIWNLTGLADARVTFEVVNTGTHPIRIHTANVFYKPNITKC